MKIFDELSGLETHADYHLARHGVLASNLSHAQTPGYVAKDLVFDEAMTSAEGVLARSDEAHFGPGGPTGAVGSGNPADPEGFSVVDIETARFDQNGVRLEKAMAQVSANRLRYEAGIEITRRRLALLRYAATDGGVG